MNKTDLIELAERLCAYAPSSGATIAFGERTTRQMNRDLNAAASVIRTLAQTKGK